MSRNDNRIGIGDLIDGFLFSLQAEGKSIRTIEYYRDLLHLFLIYTHEKNWPNSCNALDTHRVREFLSWVGSRTCEHNIGNGAKLNFHSSTHEGLIVAGNTAHYLGVGTINDEGDYGFMVTTIDGRTKGRRGADEFRIRIWDRATGEVIYDNQITEGVNSDAATELGGGSIGIK